MKEMAVIYDYDMPITSKINAMGEDDIRRAVKAAPSILREANQGFDVEKPFVVSRCKLGGKTYLMQVR